jgi:signal transduction histidine kinase
MLVRRPAWLPHPMVLAIAATFCAAALVLYFQHRAISTLRSQTRVILTQISEQTASDVAAEVRRTLDGPVYDTLTAVNHPDLRTGRLDLVAREFETGLKAYPQVDRFFAWTSETEAAAPGEAVFFGRHASQDTIAVGGGDGARFARDPALGRAIMALAREHVGEQHIYVAEDEVGDRRHQVFLRLFFSDALRVEYFAILGFVVDPETLHGPFFAALHDRSLASLLKTRGGDVPLELRVTDDNGVRVFGQPDLHETAAGVDIPMQYHPVDRILSRLTSRVAPRVWRIEVAAPPGHGLLGDTGGGYGATALSIVLMLVALGLTLQASRRSAELTRMQADFISHVSHQLKTPLSLLSAATETVTMDRVRSPEKLAQYVGIIRAEVARLSALVQRILEFSRLQQARGYEFEPVDLGALVRETVAAFESSLAGQRFTFHLEEQDAPPIIADPAAIEQALVNLLDNAVKYSGDERHVTVRVRAAGTDAIIEVIDRGIGIARTDMDRIFEKFYRGATSQRAGFGLGLPIVQELVHAHRGHVEVHSTEGQGSTFRLVLPSAGPNRAGAAAFADKTPEPSEVTS